MCGSVEVGREPMFDAHKLPCGVLAIARHVLVGEIAQHVRNNARQSKVLIEIAAMCTMRHGGALGTRRRLAEGGVRGIPPRIRSRAHDPVILRTIKCLGLGDNVKARSIERRLHR